MLQKPGKGELREVVRRKGSGHQHHAEVQVHQLTGFGSQEVSSDIGRVITAAGSILFLSNIAACTRTVASSFTPGESLITPLSDCVHMSFLPREDISM